MKRWLNTALRAGCISALLLWTVWFWWRHSELRMVLYGKEAHMKLVGVGMGLHGYWDENGHPPEVKSWKEKVLEYSVFEPGRPVFDSRDRLRNCFAITFAESPWTFHGSIPECRRHGDLAMAVCDPDATFQDDSSATASFDDSGRLKIYNFHGETIGILPPETTILTLYVTGTIVKQTVAELSQRLDLEAASTRSSSSPPPPGPWEKNADPP